MQRLYARRMGQTSVSAADDAVMFGVSLPSGSRVNHIRARMSCEASAAQTMNLQCLYMVEGWILPVLDPDAGAQMDTIFDQLVPKDTDTDTLDLDTGAAASGSFYEPGEHDWSELIDVGLQPERIFQRKRLLSFANNPIGFHITSGDAVKWWPSDAWALDIKKNFFVRQPSLLVFAFANPPLLDTTGTLPTVLAENEWTRFKYVTDFLHQAIIELIGLTESGAETPYDEMTTLIKKWMDPDVYEGTPGSFTPVTWRPVWDAGIDVSVEGTMGSATLSSGR